MSIKLSKKEIDIFETIAREKGLKGKPVRQDYYYHIYLKYAPAAIHYQFYKPKENKLLIRVQIDNTFREVRNFRKNILEKDERDLPLDIEEEIPSISEIEPIFNKIYNKWNDKINAWYDGTYYTKYGKQTNKGEDMKEQEKMGKNTEKNIPLNQILYGPPGTGKTYHTINKAIEIIDNDFYQDYKEDIEDNRKKLKKKFKELEKSGQIAFVTFHQSYGYEEFVEGIKPIPPTSDRNESDNNDMYYDIEKGIFKEICKNSEENLINYKNAAKGKIIFDFDDLIDKFVLSIEKDISLNKSIYLKGDAEIISVNRNKDGNFTSFTLGGSILSGQRLTRNIIKRDYNSYINGLIKKFQDIKPRYESNSKNHGNAPYYFPLLEMIKNYHENHPIKTPEEKRKNYVLIIDEINRGNISKIFGELITLIEKDKRLGADEELTAKLPYSKETFGVPQNLYIIGTMNTADRSIALMDTALRRRFQFEEMMPDPNLVDSIINGIDIKKMLTKINERIEFLYDRDHTIGHSYFMGLKNYQDLCDTFKFKIIPLLQEYFYDNWEKIQIVLGDYKDQKKEKDEKIIQDEKLPLGFVNDDYEDKISYKINPALAKGEISKEAFLKIYEDLKKNEEE